MNNEEVFIYENTKTHLPNWVDTIHENQPRGYAYISDNYFIHIYGGSSPCWPLFVELTASEGYNSKINLRDWITKNFGAQKINHSKNKPGECVAGIWRPGLYYDREVLCPFGKAV